MTTIEKRAAAFCESIREAGQASITVEWITSMTWGSNPRILYHGEKVTNVSGCGYCKHSTALADALYSLGETEEQRRRIARTGGAGVSSVISALEECGWTLENATSGKSYDVYTITRNA